MLGLDRVLGPAPLCLVPAALLVAPRALLLLRYRVLCTPPRYDLNGLGAAVLDSFVDV